MRLASFQTFHQVISCSHSCLAHAFILLREETFLKSKSNRIPVQSFHLRSSSICLNEIIISQLLTTGVLRREKELIRIRLKMILKLQINLSQFSILNYSSIQLYKKYYNRDIFVAQLVTLPFAYLVIFNYCLNIIQCSPNMWFFIKFQIFLPLYKERTRIFHIMNIL